MGAGGKAAVRVVPKPWGREVIWAHTDLYVGKLLYINAGQALSVQYHNEKDETIHLLSGKMKYRVGAKVQGPGSMDHGPWTPDLVETELKAGESFRNTPGVVHQMEAVTDCVLLEASTPHLDDVVRLKDLYGREGTSAP